ncbi:nucleotidyltransferase family protein [Candidatus Woesearchaeota archaeon]|nr:nucleotidyltransferase family protein [Candidatus Woesearchaeota archaeon]
MSKAKIAISVENSLLKLVDSKVDGSVIRSRSQAIEYFLKKGLREQSVSAAVLLLRGEHQAFALKNIKGMPLIKQQIEFFSKHGIKTVYIVTQHTRNMNLLLNEISNAKINVEIIEKQSRGNADALKALREKITHSFIVMSGDTYNNFDLFKMIKKHAESEKLATMGLMTREKTSSYGTAILDGDLVVDFQEKPRHYSTNIVNAGIYIFNPEVFELFEDAVSLEKDLFPRLAKIKQLAGFFTYGEYVHVTG